MLFVRHEELGVIERASGGNAIANTYVTDLGLKFF